ncbi:hypothetical protein ROA7450_00959 [Roseovarius albus]|uniref:YjiS-like domain-containing protein n=1 Tax=Roseovarius albus TaxID=1247867 RepID=A0A1X6YKP6_9RHOB|nr:DUF1127 domain-containing protein [Roseovarius albus]SLN23886.1 hypothetical protein ROA7450_00959 [Roseovarius albus]
MELLSRTHPTARLQPTRRGGLSTLVSLYRQRRALSKLDDASLNDIGVSRTEAQAEAKRAPWDVPSNWKA